MANENVNSSGDPMFHLRRIGPPASKDGVVDVMDFYKSVYMIGRNASRVDFYIDSSSHIQSQSLSRCHARIVRQNDNKHRLYDDSLNGVFVNNMKISASCILQEGDKVIFGHPKGARILSGTRSRQPNSEHQFMFEMCNCKNKSSQVVQSDQETFKKPITPQIGSPDNLIIGRESQPNETRNTNVQAGMTVQESAPGDTKSFTSTTQNNAKPSSTLSFTQSKTLTTNEDTTAHEQNQIAPLDLSPNRKQKEVTEMIKSLNWREDNFIEEHVDSIETDFDDVGKMDASSEMPSVEGTESLDLEISKSSDKNTSDLEDTVNLILNELSALRGIVEKDCATENSANNTNSYRSPNKDASIQTSQRVYLDILSPTKDMGIQTSQIFPSDSFTTSKIVPNSAVNVESSVTGDCAMFETAEKVCDTNKLELDFANDSSDSPNCDKTVDKVTFSPQEPLLEQDSIDKHSSVVDMSVKCNNAMEDCEESAKRIDTFVGNVEVAEENDHKEMAIDLNPNEPECATLNTEVEGVNLVESDTDKKADCDSKEDIENECIREKTDNVLVEKCDSTEFVVTNNISNQVNDTDNMNEPLGDNVCSLEADLASLDCNTLNIRHESTIEQAKPITNSKNDEFEAKSEHIDVRISPANKQHGTSPEHIENEHGSEIVENITSSEKVKITSVENVQSSKNAEIKTSSENFENKPSSENDENVLFSKYDDNEISSENFENEPSPENMEEETHSEYGEDKTNCANEIETCPKENGKNVLSLDNVEKEISSEYIDHKTGTLHNEIEKRSDENELNGSCFDYVENETHSENGTTSDHFDNITNSENEKSPEINENEIRCENVDKKAGAIHVETFYRKIEFDNNCEHEIQGNSAHVHLEALSEAVEIESYSEKNELEASVEHTDDNTNSEDAELEESSDLAAHVDGHECIVFRNIVNDKDDLTVNKTVDETCSADINDLKADSIDNADYSDGSGPDSPKIYLSNSVEFSDECSDNSSDESDGYEEITDEENEVSNYENNDHDEKSASNDEEKKANVEVSIGELKVDVEIEHKENFKKRKTSSEISDTELDNADTRRKRHCSEIINISDGDSLSMDLPDIECNVEDHLVETEESTMSEHLKKLKDGMKSFFNLSSTNTCTNDLSMENGGGYIFHQNNSGKIEQFHLDFPVTGQDNGDDNEDGDRLESVTTELVSLDNKALVSLDNKALVGRNMEGDDVYASTDVQVEAYSNCVSVDANEENETKKADKGNSEMNKTDTELNQNGELEMNLNRKHELNENDKHELKGNDDRKCDRSQKGNHELNENGNNEPNQIENHKQNQSANGKHEQNQINFGNCAVTQNGTLSDSSSRSESVDKSFVESSLVNDFSDDDRMISDKLLKDDFTSQDIVKSDDLQGSPDSSKGSPVIGKCDNNLSAWLRTLPQTDDNHEITGSDCEFSNEDDEFASPVINSDYFSNSNNDTSAIDNNSTNTEGNDIAKNIPNEDSNIDNGDETDPDERNEAKSNERSENVYTEMDIDESKADDNEGNDTDVESNLDELLNSDKLTVEKDLDNRTVNNEDRLKRSGSYEVDFDFCDSESDDISSLDNGADLSKKTSKRRATFDCVDQLWKKPKTVSQNEELNESNDEVSTPFKMPLEIGSRSSNGSVSPGTLSCTQLIESSRSPDLSTLSSTQITNITNKLEEKANDKFNLISVRTRAKSLIEKLRATRRIKEEAANDNLTSGCSTSNISSETSTVNSSIEARRGTEMAVDNINQHVKSCRNVIDNLKTMFNECVALHDNVRVQAWRKELNEAQKKLEFPKTVIAVVGNTGAGKSSLMNAVLDQRNILPTSGIRACTAVVVEVIENTTSNDFIADIEFLQRKEWFDELQILLNDLKGPDGTVKNRSPDPTSDAYVSYCKVKAVYGRVDNIHVLSRLTSVTHWLGKVKVIRSQDAEDFRKQVEKYVETQEPVNGGQYWPIVKHVTLKIPNCNVCSTGASLVDLPGVRDSNAARDKIAREYLKNCTAVWVVSSIERAIDDKTAKDLLGENFRRQLLMDGQYGSIAFICTKTDVITPSEIIRSLKLTGKTKGLAKKIKNLESEKCDLDLQILQDSQEVTDLTKSIEETKKEVTVLGEYLQELKSLLHCEDADSSQSEEKEAIKEYEDVLKEKQSEIVTMTTRIESLTEEKNFSSQKTLELDGLLHTKRRALASMCAKARNDYSKSQIRRDFKAGLKEMKRRAGVIDDQEDDIYDVDDDNDGDVGSTADNLKVFCCSSTEYQKMKNLSSDDGPPVVFSEETDTQIPQLRQYVHEMTGIRRKRSMESLIRTLGTYVFDIQTYIRESGDTSSYNGSYVKSLIDAEVDKLLKSLEPALQTLNKDVDAIFDGTIKQKLDQGANNAKREANQICTQWGAQVNRNPQNDKKTGGLHWMTYRAAVNRNGVLKSKTQSGNIDFNEDLAEPMYRCTTIVWDRAFNGLIWKAFDKLQDDILRLLHLASLKLTVQLEKLNIRRDGIDRVCAQLKNSVSNKLKDMVDVLKETVSCNQRDISRLITPHIQSSLTPVYTNCAKEKGSGMYNRMKAFMSQGIDNKRGHMFDEATLQLMEALIKLQNKIVDDVRRVCEVITTDMKAAFEPLWNTPGNSNVLKSAFMNQILTVCSNVRKIYNDVGLTNTEERTVNTSTSSHQDRPSDSGMPTQQAARIKMEKTTGRDTPIGIVNYNLQMKQERKVFDTCDVRTLGQQTGVTQFGEQTLQDLQAGKLDISPVEVTVQSTPRMYVQSRQGERIVYQHGALPSTSQGVLNPNSFQTFQDCQYVSQPSVIQSNMSTSGQPIVGLSRSATISANYPAKQQQPTVSIINKENDFSRSDSLNQPMVSSFSSQCRGPNKQSKNLSLSQRNNGANISIPTVSVVNIKTEPTDNGSQSIGRRRLKYLGTIDLTDD
ncbi:hypothetical protein ACF0H5_006198 [Mactra antiquata]